MTTHRPAATDEGLREADCPLCGRSCEHGRLDRPPMPSDVSEQPVVTAYLCAETYVEGDQICALFRGHPLDRGPGHVWVSVETLIEAGTVAWRYAASMPLAGAPDHE